MHLALCVVFASVVVIVTLNFFSLICCLLTSDFSDRGYLISKFWTSRTFYTFYSDFPRLQDEKKS